ncbi:MAG TPA: ribonuclease III domain-containing protein [Bacillota bacterium]
MTEANYFNMPEINPNEYSPAVWAYIGDAVYELFVRSHLVTVGPAKTQVLHKQAVKRVRASFQAELTAKLEPYLSQEELDILRRGRNVKSGHVPTASDPITYRYSTAFEALIGYLYLCGRQGRLAEILQQVLEFMEER